MADIDLLALLEIRAADNASSVIDGASGHLQGFAKTFAEVGIAAVAAGIGIGAAAVDMAGHYQDATVQMQNDSGSTAAQAKAVADAFLTTAGTSTFSANAIMEAYGPVSGQLKTTEGHVLDTADAMTVMKVATDLADASNGDLTSTTSDLSKVMQAFQIPVSGAAQSSDILFNAANATGNSIDSLTSTLTRARSMMGAAAPSMGDLSSLMVDLAAHGETGRAAISSLNSAFTGIITPSKQVSAAWAEQNLNFKDAQGNLLPLDQIFQQIAPHIKGMGDAQGVAYLKSIGFGSASTKLFETIQSGAGVFDQYRTQIEQSGTVATAAANKQATLGGEIDILKASIVDMGISIGQQLLPYVQQFVGMINANMPTIKTVMGGVVTFLGAALLGLAKALQTIIPIFVQWVGFIAQQIIPVVKQLAGWFTGTLVPALESLWSSLQKNVLPTLEGVVVVSYNILKAMIPVGEFIVGTLIGAVKFMSDNFSWFGPILGTVVAGFIAFKAAIAVQALIQGVSMGMYMLQAGLMGVTTAEVGGTTASLAFGAALRTAWLSGALPFALAIGAIILVGALLITHWDQVKAAAEDVWHAVSGFFTSLGDDIKAVITNVVSFVKDHWQLLLAIFLGPFGLLIDFVVDNFNTIKTVISDAIGIIVDIFKVAWDIISTATKIAFNIIVGVIKVAVSAITLAWDIITTILSVPFHLAVAIIQVELSIITGIIKVAINIITLIWDVITTILSIPVHLAVELIKIEINIIVTIIKALISVITTVWNTITSILAIPIQFAVTQIGNILGTIPEIIRIITSLIVTAWDDVVGFIVGPIRDAIGEVGNIIHGIISIVTTVASIIGNIFGGMATGITGAFNGVKNFLSGVFGAIGNIIKAPINAVIDILNGLIGAIDNVKISVHLPSWLGGAGFDWGGLGIPRIPELAEGGIIQATPGGTVVRVGEAGQDEAVVPLSSSGLGGGNGTVMQVNIDLRNAVIANNQSLQDLANLLGKMIVKQLPGAGYVART